MTSNEQTTTSSGNTDMGIPICFPMKDYGPPPPNPESMPSGGRKHKLHGADDLIILFNLRPLWDRSAKPYSQAFKRPKEDEGKVKEENKDETGGAIEEKAKVMEKTYVDYVRDLPGRVRPSRRLLNRYMTAQAKSAETGQPHPEIPHELTGRTTMRDIVWRPETTIQRVGPFDEELLRAAFTVEAGEVPEIDLTLLESDEIEKQSPTKKKKKRRHPRDQTDEATAAKRSRLNNFAGNANNSK